MNYAIFFMLYFGCSVCVAQKPAGSVSTQGNCNGSAIGSNITVTVTCDPSTSKEQAKALATQYTEILRKIHQEHLSFDVVIQKLDSIQKGVDDLKVASAPRHLTQLQILNLRARMAAITQPSEELLYPMNDPEAVGYAKDFINALGLQSPHVVPVGMLMPGIGIHFTVAKRFLSPVSANQAMIVGVPPECLITKIFLENEQILFESHFGPDDTQDHPRARRAL